MSKKASTTTIQRAIQLMVFAFSLEHWTFALSFGTSSGGYLHPMHEALDKSAVDFAEFQNNWLEATDNDRSVFRLTLEGKEQLEQWGLISNRELSSLGDFLNEGYSLEGDLDELIWEFRRASYRSYKPEPLLAWFKAVENWLQKFLEEEPSSEFLKCKEEIPLVIPTDIKNFECIIESARGFLIEKAFSKLVVNKESSKIEAHAAVNIFIGHGRSSAWKDLKEFLNYRLKLQYDEFNRVSPAGVTTTARLSEMLNGATFAFIVLTAEDETAEGKFQARMNVIHEAGLFQGRLGFEKAIILLEEGCEEFSNIQGLGQIRFPKGNISAKFEEIRMVLERENILN